MKKVISVILVLLISFSFFACSKDNSEEDAKAQEEARIRQAEQLVLGTWGVLGENGDPEKVASGTGGYYLFLEDGTGAVGILMGGVATYSNPMSYVIDKDTINVTFDDNPDVREIPYTIENGQLVINWDGTRFIKLENLD